MRWTVSLWGVWGEWVGGLTRRLGRHRVPFSWGSRGSCCLRGCCRDRPSCRGDWGSSYIWTRCREPWCSRRCLRVCQYYCWNEWSEGLTITLLLLSSKLAHPTLRESLSGLQNTSLQRRHLTKRITFQLLSIHRITNVNLARRNSRRIRKQSHVEDQHLRFEVLGNDCTAFHKPWEEAMVVELVAGVVGGGFDPTLSRGGIC
ncbi:hypothetical protein B0J14DRAFT_109023 [Halenospora varia]|nr:hypothetical protein B0J14DRAFT_109023 [Halenospora varia]